MRARQERGQERERSLCGTIQTSRESDAVLVLQLVEKGKEARVRKLRREKRRDSLRPCHCCHYMSMSVRRGHGSWSSVTVAGTDEPTDDARGEAMPPFQTIRFAR
jgi:hypothetical protein